MMPQTESKGTAVLSKPRRYKGWVVNATPRPLYTPGMTRYTLYTRLGGPVWAGLGEEKVHYSHRGSNVFFKE